MTIDSMRRDKGHLTVEATADGRDIWETLASPEERPDRSIEKKNLSLLLGQEIRLLPPRDRLICQLLFIRGKTADETAALLGLSVDLIYSRKHRIMARLKKSLSGV